MRILLIQPPIEDFYITQQRMQPTGLLYLASALEKAGHEVRMMDLLTAFGSTRIPIDPELEYLSQYYEHDLSPYKIFMDFHRFGATIEQANTMIADETFDICGISANFTAYWKQPIEIALIVKNLFPTVPVVLGGNAVPVIWEKALVSGLINYVVFGEGENTFMNFLQNLEAPEQVNNIAFLKDGIPFRTEIVPDFDINLASIDLKYIETDNYKIGKRKMASIVTSRGCPLKCAYCTATMNCLAPFQYRDLNIVFNEITNLVTNYGIMALNIEDENFTLNKDFARAFLERKTTEFPSLRLYFMNGLHYPSLDNELLKLLRKADCMNLGIALVDSQNTDLIARPADMEKFEKIVRFAITLGFIVTVYVIAGLPKQTSASVKKMIDMIHSLGAVAAISIYYPMPGTPLFDDLCKKNSAAKKIRWSQMRSSAMAYEQPQLSRAQLVDLFHYTRMINTPHTPVQLPDYSTETKGDICILKMERKFSADELKTYLFQRFNEYNEFLILKEQKNGQYGADYTFKIVHSHI